MPLHVVALGQARLDAGDELLLEGVRVGSRALDQVGPIPHDLAAHDLVDPCLVDFQLAQLIGQCIGIAAGGEIRGRALQHGDVRTTVGKRWYEGRRRRPRADHGHALAGEIDRIGPMLRMHNLTLELLKPRPGGCISLAMPVVALAHPEKARLDLHRFPGVVHGKVQRPGAGRTGPRGRLHAMLVADVRPQLFVLNGRCKVVQDLLARGNGLALPGLEVIAKRKEVAVRACAGVFVNQPGAPGGLHGIHDEKAPLRAMLAQQCGAADAGDAGAHNDHVKTLGSAGCGIRILAG